MFKPLLKFGSNTKAASEYVAKNPTMKGYLQKILTGAQTVPGKLKSLSTTISKKFPKGSEFINSIMGGIGNVINNIITSIKSLLGTTGKIFKTTTGGTGKLGVGTRAGLGTTGLIYGVDKLSGNGTEDLVKAIENNPVKADFSDEEI